MESWPLFDEKKKKIKKKNSVSIKIQAVGDTVVYRSLTMADLELGMALSRPRCVVSILTSQTWTLGSSFNSDISGWTLCKSPPFTPRLDCCRQLGPAPFGLVGGCPESLLWCSGSGIYLLWPQWYIELTAQILAFPGSHGSGSCRRLARTFMAQPSLTHGLCGLSQKLDMCTDNHPSLF